MSEDSARLSSLTVLGGLLHGRTYQLSREPEEITIGSDPSCRFRLEAPSVAPLHARIVADETGAAIFDARSPRGIFLNFEKVELRAALSDGDMLRLGPPQERESVMIQLEFGGPLAEAPAAAPAPVAAAEDEALIADLSAPDDAFVLSEEPVPPVAEAPPSANLSPPATPATVPPVSPPVPQAVPAAPAVAEATPDDEFFVAAEPEPDFVAPAPPAPPALAPPVPAAETTSLGSVPYGVDEGDFALPAFDPNWSTSPGAAPKPAPPPSADEFFLSEPPAPGSVAAEGDFYSDAAAALPPLAGAAPRPKPQPSSPTPSDGLSFAADDQPLTFDEGPASAKAKAAAPPPPAAPAITVKAEAPPPAEPAPVAPLRPRPARRPPAEEGASPAPRPRSASPRPRPAGGSGSGRTLATAGGGLAALGLLAFLGLRFFGGGAKITGIEPARAKAGQTVVLAGGPFAADLSANEVLFADQAATVLEGDTAHLKVQVPTLTGPPGQDMKVPVKVRVGGKDTRPFSLTVFGGPTIVGISPDVAMPGEEVVLAGTGWGAAPAVQFGGTPAEVIQASPTSLRVRVPDLAGGVGSPAPAVVSEGGAESNPAPFYVGRIPLLLKVEPSAAVPGDLVVLSGRGLRRLASENSVAVGGVRVLVISAADSEVRFVAPFSALAAAGGLELRVAGSDNAARAAFSVMPSSDVVDFRFAAQPFDAAPGRDHVVLATGLGPAFVIAAAGGKSAAERAYDVQQRLNQAGTLLKASRDVDVELRNADAAPVLALVGKAETLLEVTEEDAAAYNEDWTGLKGRGGPVTRTRLARWWEAVAKDLVLMLVRGGKPVNAAALAPEGRVLGDVSQAAQKTGRFGVPWSVVDGLRPPQRDALRLLALRVPASVTGPGAGAAAGPQAATLKLDGLWVGFEREGAQRRDVSASFGGGTGSISIEAAVTLTLPLLTLETRKTEARWSLQFRGGTRYYSGKWDGALLNGTISLDPAGKDAVGTFELKPR